MLPKDITALKKKMQLVCNIAIDELIAQLVLNEDYHKVDQNDPLASLKAIDLDVKFMMNVKDKGDKIKPFKMFCNPIVNLDEVKED